MASPASPKNPTDRPLRVAWLIYRGNPHCGGQGVYTRYVAREVAALGHHIEVLAGQPWPELDDPAQLVKIPGLDLYRSSNPFRVPWPWEFRDRTDLAEFAYMCTGGFPEPWAFSVRARKYLQTRRNDFDLIHDNQCFGTGLLGMMQDGWPVMATLHHPITVDRDLELEHASNAYRRYQLRRWYAFLGMQMKVAREFPRLVTVSQSSKRDIVAQMGVQEDRLHIVPVGVDEDSFRPMPNVARVPGRLMTTASADVPLKGLTPLLEGLAKLRTENPEAHLVIIGRTKEKSATPALIERLGLTGHVEFVSGVPQERIVELYAEASRCRPSRPWPAGSRSSPRPVAPCPRSSVRTARPPSPSSPAIRTPLRWRSAGCSTTHRCATASARPAATACSATSRGGAPPRG